LSFLCFSPPLLVGGQIRSESQPVVNPFGQDPARREAGHLRFQSTCSSCHGANGEGGQGEGHGPNLIDNPEIRRLKDSGIFNIIHNGIPGTLMPRFSLPDGNIWELVTFIRGLNAPAILMNVPGNQQKGEAIFYGRGECGTCHMIRGRGGYLGSDLTNIGSAARLEDLRRFIEAPPLGAPDGFRSAFLVTSEGRKVRAVVKHRSNWSLQILDENGQLHLLSGPAMNQVTLLPNSWMQGYSGKLKAEEIQDLLAFLSRQSVIEDQVSASVSGAEVEK
jgi:cytochrome c oxidase cbb3-type subunit 3